MKIMNHTTVLVRDNGDEVELDWEWKHEDRVLIPVFLGSWLYKNRDDPKAPLVTLTQTELDYAEAWIVGNVPYEPPSDNDE